MVNRMTAKLLFSIFISYPSLNDASLHMKETKEESTVFSSAMKGVKRLAHTKINPIPTKTGLFRKKRPSEEIESQSTFSDHDTLEPVTADDALCFFKSGVQTKRIQKMRTGQCPIEATLDLHGMKIEGAREILHRFLVHCLDQHIRNVLIVHGKGRSQSHPIIKNKLNHWLRQSADVLGFCSATPKHGARGAVYVLLKSQ